MGDQLALAGFSWGRRPKGGQAVTKHRRRAELPPAEAGPPYGLLDLPGPVDAELVLVGGIYGDAQFRACHGTTVVEPGLRNVNTHAARRALTWRPEHPRDRAVLRALRRPAGPWELGWREATADG